MMSVTSTWFNPPRVTLTLKEARRLTVFGGQSVADELSDRVDEAREGAGTACD
jgi:hypothetical protein